jgi:hypothetical protein
MSVVLALAAPIDRDRRDAFLHAVVNALAREPTRGPGVAHRVGREVQRGFYDAPRMSDCHDARSRSPRQGYAYPAARRS